MSKKDITTGRLTLGVSRDDVEVFLVATNQKKRKDFVIIPQWVLSSMVAESRLNATDIRLFLLLASQIDYQNRVIARVSDLTKKLGVSSETYYRSLRKLAQLGYVIRGREVGAPWYLMLSPYAVSRCSVREQKELQELFDTYLLRIDSAKMAE